MELTLLMPCLDEIRTLGRCIGCAQRFLREHRVDGEVLVADNGSTDGSPALARSLGARVIHVQRRGYGSALDAGIRSARARFVIMADADLSYDFSESDALLRELRNGADMVIGSRYAGGFEPGAMPPSHRYLGVPVLSLCGRIAAGVPVQDFHCGLRGVCTARYLTLGACSPGMEYASEMIILAGQAGFDVRQVPVHLYRDGRDGPPHLRSVRDGLRHLRLIARLLPGRLR